MKKFFHVNYFGALRLAKAVVPYMEKAGKGKVIFTSSGVGIMGFPDISLMRRQRGLSSPLPNV